MKKSTDKTKKTAGEFPTTITKLKGKGYKAILPFEFDEDGDATEDNAVAIPSKIHLMPIGQWEHDFYGPMIINASDIREFQQNFNAGIRKGVFITAGHEGFMELPAVGWITEVESRDNGLWGTVEWNDLGKETLSDKQFKFFSPELYRDYEDPETHQLYRNVLTGGALTKSPYFKELESIVFSDRNIKNNFNDTNTMNLKELLEKEVSTLNDEEKAFIKEHSSELNDEEKAKVTSIIDEPEANKETDEEKATREAKEKEDANVAAGLNPDGSTKEAPDGKIEASDKNVKMTAISASELAILREKADNGQEAFAELQKIKIEKVVSELVFSESNKAGFFLPKSKAGVAAFMETLNDKQKASFTAIIKELPKSKIFGEVGSDNGAQDGSAKFEVESKVKAKIEASEKSGKIMKYSDALKEVMSENDGLEERYDKEL